MLLSLHVLPRCDTLLGLDICAIPAPELCVLAAQKANHILGISGTKRSTKVILSLYYVLMRPHLEYYVKFWSL